MKIEIYDNPSSNSYTWILYDGPDGIDAYEGISNSLGEAFESIVYYREYNSLNYCEATSESGTYSPTI
jgi:hypothetical protein